LLWTYRDCSSTSIQPSRHNYSKTSSRQDDEDEGAEAKGEVDEGASASAAFAAAVDDDGEDTDQDGKSVVEGSATTPRERTTAKER